MKGWFRFLHLKTPKPKLIPKAGIYHKVCFKCDNCQKNLDTLSAQYLETQNDNGLFCHKCFEEKFGSITNAPNIYSETSKIIAVDDKGCPRCGGAVYHAEEIFEGGRSYHKKCFSCKTCKKNISSKRQGEEKHILDEENFILIGTLHYMVAMQSWCTG